MTESTQRQRRPISHRSILNHHPVMFLKKITRRAIQIGLILVVSVVLVEVLMIVSDRYFFKSLYEYDPDMGFRARAYFPAGEVRITNQFGFNDRDYPLSKSPGTLRILVVGDSFGWAGGLEGNYTALIETMFERRYGSHKVDVINTGYPGTHTGEQLIMLKKYALQYNPDLVILGFFAGNDFFDAGANRKRLLVNGCFVDIDKRYEYRFLGYPVITQSRALVLLKQKYELHNRNKQASEEARERVADGKPAPFRNLPENNF